MLGKLLKYDIKAQLKEFIGMYIMLFMTSVLLLIAGKLGDAYPQATLFTVAKGLLIFLFVLEITGVFIATWIMSLLRYRKNMLKDEGYLMHTLPVSAAQLHFSKLIVSVFWYAMDTIAAIIAAMIAYGDMGVMKRIIDSLKSSTDGQLGVSVLLLFAAAIIISIIMTQSQIYVSLCLGHTSYGNKDLMSFVAYIVTYIISQVVSLIALMIYFLTTTGSFMGMITTSTSVNKAMSDVEVMAVEMESLNMVKGMMIVSIVVVLLISVAYNVVSVYVLNKKLNLE